jgi:hypothetical protein
MKHEEIAAVFAKPISQEPLRSSIPARLAYVGVDGEPRVIPIGFLWTGQHVLVHTAPKAAKVRQMALITIGPDWAKPLDFETTIPKAVEDLVRARHGAGVVDG